VAIGIVPFGALVANILIDNGILAQGTPEARQGLARGQMVGGIIGILWGGKPNASTPVQAGAPVPATVGGAAAPPLVVVPSGVGVVVAAGGAVNVAAAEGEIAASLSTGGGDGKEKLSEPSVVPKGGTYILRDPVTGQVMRTGRTNDLARRATEHGRDPALRDFIFEPVHKTDVYAEQRGLEQLLHEAYRPPLNHISPVRANNPRLKEYLDAAQQFLEAQ
jgi:hypothetical protein